MRVLIYQTTEKDGHIFANVLKESLKDLREDIKKNINSKPSDSKKTEPPNLTAFKNSKEPHMVTVSFGTGEDYFSRLKENKLYGYNLDKKGIFGIFVSPHNVSFVTSDDIKSRTRYYACRTPIKYFDKPIGITFNVSTDQLFHINYNADETVITQEALPTALLTEITKEMYQFKLEDLPANLFSATTIQEIEARYDQNTSKILINHLNKIKEDVSLGSSLIFGLHN